QAARPVQPGLSVDDGGKTGERGLCMISGILSKTGRTMTTHARDFSASIDPVKLDRLAEVVIKVGLQLQPGQDLVLTSSIPALPLTRKIVEHAYRAGAG